MKRLSLFVVMLALATASCGPAATPTDEPTVTHTPSAEVIIGGLFTLTGPTSEVGTPYYNGVRNYIEYKNEQGGVAGKYRVRLILDDTSYNVEKALSIYDRLVHSSPAPLGILGWGTGETFALQDKIAQDKIPFMSASYAAVLSDPAQNPYNFIIGTTYSDQLEIAVQYLIDQRAKEQTSGTPTYTLLMHNSAFGESVLYGTEEFFASRNITLDTYKMVGDNTDQIVGQTIAHLQSIQPTYAIIQNTYGPAAAVVKAAYDAGIETQFVVLNWATDNEFITSCGTAAAEGVLGVTPFAFPGTKSEGVKLVDDWLAKRGSSVHAEGIHYTQGWATASIMIEAIERMARANAPMNSVNLKTELEKMTNFSTGGILPDLTFSPSSHKGVQAAWIYVVKNGYWSSLTDSGMAAPSE